MSEIITKKVTVVGAELSIEARCVVFMVESPDRRFYTQVPIRSLLPNVTNLDDFSDDQIKECFKYFCKDIIGKKINALYDPDLDEKIKDRIKLDYKKNIK